MQYLKSFLSNTLKIIFHANIALKCWYFPLLNNYFHINFSRISHWCLFTELDSV